MKPIKASLRTIKKLLPKAKWWDANIKYNEIGEEYTTAVIVMLDKNEVYQWSGYKRGNFKKQMEIKNAQKIR